MSNAFVLKRSPLFAQLSSEELARLAGLARVHRHDREHVIFNEGDAGTALYVIVKGRVKISRSTPDGKERTLALLGPGDVFGDLALLDGKPRSADAVVAEDAELLVVPRDEFRVFVLEQPQVALSLMVVLSERLRRTNLLVHDAAFFDARGRLARVLLELARPDADAGAGGTLVCPRFTQSELASMVGVTRESVNKWLRYYERNGTVTKRGGRLVVLNPEQLTEDIS